MVTIGVLKEAAPLEKRVALVPSCIKRLTSKGKKVAVQAGAGVSAHISDADFKAAGAEIVADAGKLLKQVDALVSVNQPSEDVLKGLKPGSTLVGMMGDLSSGVQATLDQKKATVFALEKMPRISRAQVMDVLSSQATVAGYAAMMLAAYRSSVMCPLLMTSAGTVRAANVLVLGAGVAGLQVIATAKRLGAAVSATDIRPEAAEQVQSLGATFISLSVVDTAQDSGGYARQTTQDQQKDHQAQLAARIGKFDIVVTTALVPGKKAPCLVTKETVEKMRPGAVLVDMAAAQGGNCALTNPGKEVVQNGVLILGPENLTSLYAKDASTFYSNNVLAFLDLLNLESGKAPALEDEIAQKTCVLDGSSLKEAAQVANKAQGEDRAAV